MTDASAVHGCGSAGKAREHHFAKARQQFGMVGASTTAMPPAQVADRLNSTIHHERIRADGVELHVAVGGTGPPVILLHGFPENWTSWRWQFSPLVEAGLSVWAPDMRGYNESDQPTARRAYHLQHLINDVAAIVRASGHPRAHVVGHDWGGIVAWTFAGYYPELLDKLVILNAPHMGIFLDKVRRPPQMLRSSYVLLFQIPGVAEWTLSAWNYWLLRKSFPRLSARCGAFRDGDIDHYVRGLSAPGALTAALNYYRANMGREPLALARRARVKAETLVIWGDQDPALGVELLDDLQTVAPHARIHHIADAGHWVQNEAPDEVNRMMAAFLRP
jgi:epoxide hydrolase 4